MHKPNHVYLAGGLTGAMMGIFSSFFSYMIIVAIFGGIDFLQSGRMIMNLLLFVNIFVGAVVGLIVSLFVHKITKSL